MATVIVLPKRSCVDGLACAVALYEYLPLRYGTDPGDIKFEFCAKNQTYRGIQVVFSNMFERYKGDYVYHVGMAGGVFDKRSRFWKNTKEIYSSLGAMRLYLHLDELLPHWAVDVFDIVDLAEQGSLRGKGNIQHMVRGWRRKGFDDARVFALFRAALDGILENGKAAVQADSVEHQAVKSLTPVSNQLGKIRFLSEDHGEFGRVGFVEAPHDILGRFVPRMKRLGVRVYVAADTTSGYTGVFGSFDDDCLLDLGMVQAVRKAEAEKRGIDLSEADLNCIGDVGGIGLESGVLWFAFKPERTKRVISLKNGSDVICFPPEHRTRLTLDELIDIVRGCIVEYQLVKALDS